MNITTDNDYNEFHILRTSFVYSQNLHATCKYTNSLNVVRHTRIA